MQPPVHLQTLQFLKDVILTTIPDPTLRVPLTVKTCPFVLLPVIPLIYLAYLARQPHTRPLRLLVLPLVIWSTLKASYSYVWLDPRFNVYNFAGGLWGITAISKALEYTFASPGRFKVTEVKVEVANGEPPRKKTKPPPYAPRGGLGDALELIAALRGLGWDFGVTVYVPRETRPLERGAFLRATAKLFVLNYFILDFLEACIKLVPGVGSAHGGTIFLPSLPLLPRLALSTTLHFMTGLAFFAGFNMVYYLLTILAIILLGHSPESWPPLFDRPWAADSLHSFWAKRWHQLFRQTFLIMGGYPGQLIGGKVGLVLGTFLASGLYHNFAMFAMGRSTDRVVTLFFVSQGFGVIGERVWRKVTGRRVGGWPGTIWAYFMVIGLGQGCIDAFHRRGLGGGMVIPPVLSPARLLLFPTVVRVFESYVH